MANNCIISHLMSSVDNNLLPGIGDFLIDVTEQNINASLEIHYTDTDVTAADVLSSDGTVLETVSIDGNKKITLALNSLASGVSHIMVHNKYKITKLKGNSSVSDTVTNFKFKFSDLSYLQNLISIDTPTLTLFKSGAQISDIPEDSSLFIMYVGREHIAGKIEDFLMYPLLRSISIRYTTGIIIGELKDFAEKAYNKYHSGSDIPNFDYKYKLEMKAPEFIFNGTSYDTSNWAETKVLSDKVTVTIGSTLVGTYDGSTWSYS